jgi:aromatic ring-cleaving dioxygenase
MLCHDNLSILVHPLTGNALPEHRDYAAWIGTPLSLRLEVFEHL